MSKISIVIVSLLLCFTFTPVNSTTTPDPKAPRNPLGDDGIHDKTNPSIASLQEPNASMKEFPKDRRNEVNWVKAIQSGLINPRKTLKGAEYDDNGVMLEMDMDIIMKNTQFMPYVRFPHLAHTQWLSCSNCHPKIFIPQEGANPINMDGVLKGEFCGRCHDKVSFSLFICERCHSIVHEGSGPKWW